jgi:hypothetical protein
MVAKKRTVKRKLASKKRATVKKITKVYTPHISDNTEWFRINFHVSWGFEGYILGRKTDGRQIEALVKVGCARLSSRADAEDRWENGRSTESDEPRPDAAGFIEWCVAEFTKRGYKW